MAEENMKESKKMNKLERLKVAFETQTRYLALFTTVDFKLFIGYITLQLALAGWMVNGVLGKEIIPIAGLLLVDTAIAIAAWALLWKNHTRRVQEIAKLNNICEAMGYYEENEFDNLPENSSLFGEKGKSRSALGWYVFVIVLMWIGVTAVLIGRVF